MPLKMSERCSQNVHLTRVNPKINWKFLNIFDFQLLNLNLLISSVKRQHLQFFKRFVSLFHCLTGLKGRSLVFGLKLIALKSGTVFRCVFMCRSITLSTNTLPKWLIWKNWFQVPGSWLEFLNFQSESDRMVQKVGRGNFPNSNRPNCSSFWNISFENLALLGRCTTWRCRWRGVN